MPNVPDFSDPEFFLPPSDEEVDGIVILSPQRDREV